MTPGRLARRAAAPHGAPADTDAFRRELVAWLQARFGRDGVAFADDTLLFEGRLIDSLRILELIAFTERALSLRIPDAAVRMDNFRTPARIAAVFGAMAREGHDAVA